MRCTRWKMETGNGEYRHAIDLRSREIWLCALSLCGMICRREAQLVCTCCACAYGGDEARRVLHVRGSHIQSGTPPLQSCSFSRRLAGNLQTRVHGCGYWLPRGVWDPIPFAGNPVEPNLSFAFSSNAVTFAHHHVLPHAKLCSIVNAELVSTHTQTWAVPCLIRTARHVAFGTRSPTGRAFAWPVTDCVQWISLLQSLSVDMSGRILVLGLTARALHPTCATLFPHLFRRTLRVKRQPIFPGFLGSCFHLVISQLVRWAKFDPCMVPSRLSTH